MHEMNIAASILELASEEAARQNCNRLLRVRVHYGVLTGIMPEALRICFAALTNETGHKGVELELIRLPLRLRCPMCANVFEGEGQESIWNPCPQCGEAIGHIVEQGRELLLAQLEAIRD